MQNKKERAQSKWIKSVSLNLPYLEKKRRRKKQGKTCRIVRDAIKRGILKRKPCCICGYDKKVLAHHETYDRPLMVFWLCRKCHWAIHFDVDRLYSSPKRRRAA